MKSIYDHPFYYELAFSFRKIKKEVDFLEECIKKFSKVKVKNVLEIGCGPSPYSLELARRGYHFTGLDINKKMLEYSLKKAKKHNIKIDVIHANMKKFRTKKKFDFAFVMLGSIFVTTNEEFLKHLDCVANVLKRGALYVMDGLIKFKWDVPNRERWKIKKRGIYIEVIYEERKPFDYINQTFLDYLELKVREGKKKKTLIEKTKRKFIFPQEFLALVKLNSKFEFINWYADFTFEPLKIKRKPQRTIAILRKSNNP